MDYDIKLPVLFRTLDKKEITEKKLERIIEMIKVESIKEFPFKKSIRVTAKENLTARKAIKKRFMTP